MENHSILFVFIRICRVSDGVSDFFFLVNKTFISVKKKKIIDPNLYMCVCIGVARVVYEKCSRHFVSVIKTNRSFYNMRLII